MRIVQTCAGPLAGYALLCLSCVLSLQFSSKGNASTLSTLLPGITSDPEGDLLGGRPSYDHGHCGKNIGVYSFPRPYLLSIQIDVILGSTQSMEEDGFVDRRRLTRGMAIIEKNNRAPPQEGIRFHSGIARWRLANRVLLRGTGSLAKARAIYRILAACFWQLATTAGACALYPFSFAFRHESTGAHGGGSSLT
ncbi:hypothetical protein BJY52DRAFT_1414785 [Lactarius psammicola]|nr:hypothetical protein BJY52DRAFT_1414785 [Lactarius psammicola]